MTIEWDTELSQSLTITYMPQLTTSYATGDFELGSIFFHLEAAEENGDPIIDLSSPLTLTVSYDEEQLPAGMDENDLEIRRYDTDLGEWVALTLISRDTVADTLSVLLDHFSEFALMAPKGFKVCLPFISG